jgi:hypothetical protein
MLATSDVVTRWLEVYHQVDPPPDLAAQTATLLTL